MLVLQHEAMLQRLLHYLLFRLVVPVGAIGDDGPQTRRQRRSSSVRPLCFRRIPASQSALATSLSILLNACDRRRARSWTVGAFPTGAGGGVGGVGAETGLLAGGSALASFRTRSIFAWSWRSMGRGSQSRSWVWGSDQMDSSPRNPSQTSGVGSL